MGDLIHKTKVVPFIGRTYDMSKQDWIQIKKSTTFTLALNPQTKTFDFISSEQPEEEIDSYQPSLAQSLVMFKNEPDYEMIFNMLYELPTGEKAHRPVLVVFFKEKASYTKDGKTEEVYKTWWINSLVKLNQMDTTNENIDFDLSFNEIKRGAVRIDNHGNLYFAEGKFESGIFTPADGVSFPEEENGAETDGDNQNGGKPGEGPQGEEGQDGNDGETNADGGETEGGENSESGTGDDGNGGTSGDGDGE